MTQAKITCEHLLRAPHLIHLDAYLAMIGQPSRASRPDLIGLSLPSLDCTIAVEAKGRTGGRIGRVTGAAKKQAQSLPAVVSASSAVRVASVASFDPRGCWEAYLEDPPGTPTAMAPLTAGSLLAAYTGRWSLHRPGPGIARSPRRTASPWPSCPVSTWCWASRQSS